MPLKADIARHAPKPEALEILKYIGPGFLVTVGFIDPGNWAANIAAGSYHGYPLLWMEPDHFKPSASLDHLRAHLPYVLTNSYGQICQYPGEQDCAHHHCGYCRALEYNASCAELLTHRTVRGYKKL